MNIFLRELKANVRSLIIWGVIVVLFTVMGFTKFAAYAENPDMLAVLDQMPQAILEAFNMNAFNLTTLNGFYGVMFSLYALMLSIAAAMWGSDIISKEERDKTVEFSLTLPVTRGRLVTAKILAALVHCLALLAITWAATVGSVQSYQPDREFYGFLNRSLVPLFLLQLVFLSIGVFLGCAMRRYKQASSAAISILLGSYFLSIISDLSEDLDFLRYLTPFKYFDAGMLLREARIEMTYVWISLGIILVSLAAGYLTYARRDLYI